MPVMTKLRKEDLSLYYLIKDYILHSFVEFEEAATLTFVDSLSSSNNDTSPDTNSYVYDIVVSTNPSPTQRGRGFTYFDEGTGTNCCHPYILVSGTRADGVTIIGTPEQHNRVIVYDADYSIIVPEEYMIDYVDCRVVTSGSCSPAYIDYYWNYISIIDEWELLASIDPPVIVIDVKPLNKGAYQLGGGKHVKRAVDLHVFASSSAERNDIVETVYDGLYNKTSPIYDFPLGSVLDYDGTWYGRKDNPNKLTSLFDRGVVDGPIGNAWFDNVEVKHIDRTFANERDPMYLDKSNRYRAKISFYMNYYTGF